MPAQGPLSQLPAHLADALDDAVTLSEQAETDLAYPWVDRATNQLVVDTVSRKGEGKARSFVSQGRAARVPTKVRPVSFSRAHLERIKDEAIDIDSARMPDGDLVFQTEPDPAHNRVIVTVERLSDRLLVALAARYGTEAIAVRVDPDRPSLQGRRNDVSPFWGGALIRNPSGSYCSNAFSWSIGGTTHGMLTAGHCTPSGGSVSTPAMSMGSVTSGSRESWKDGVGTVYMTGQSTYYGDIALIQITSGKSSAPSIFRGGPDSTSTARVRSMPTRRSQAGDVYCTGGSTTGELCGWKVENVGINNKYDSGEVVRTAVKGGKQDKCTRGGDSGGPVYTVRSDGGIVAKGIHSGGGGGGSDSFGGYWDPCREIFTDIWDAHNGLPGGLKIN